MPCRLIALFCLILPLAAKAAEPSYVLEGELNPTALSGLMDAWDMDAFQEKTGLPANLRFSTIQEYLVEAAQLRELPEDIAREVTGSPFVPEGLLDGAAWKGIHSRWGKLPLARKIPLLKISHFDSGDQARALIWGLKSGASMPPIRKAAAQDLKDLVAQFDFEAGKTGLKFRSNKETGDFDKVLATVEALLQASRDEADLNWVVHTEDRNVGELAERYRFQIRLQTGEDSFHIVDKNRISLFWHDTDILEGWLALMKLPDEEASKKLADSLKTSLGKPTIEEWTSFINDAQTPLAVLVDSLEYFSQWPARIPESQDFVTAYARAMQSRLRPFKVLQMGPKTDVVSLLKGIQLSASLLPPEERKITLAHGAFPLAVEYQMHPEPEVLAQALALLSPENPKARKSATTRLASDDRALALTLIETLSPLNLPDPELNAALDEAITKWQWTADRDLATTEPVKPQLPYTPSLCEISLNSLVSENP